MAALQCEICGGKLQGKPGGIFECDSCGMEYTTEWAKAKIQEIKGTVKVEGTVQVAGTVKLDGPVKVEGGETTESLLQLSRIQIGQKKFDLAGNTLDQVLSRLPDSADVAFLRWMIQMRCTSIRELVRRRPVEKLLSSEQEIFFRAKELGDSQTKADIALYYQIDEEIRLKQRQAEEEAKLQEQKFAQQLSSWADDAKAYRKKIAPFRNKIALQADLLLAVNQDGTLLMEQRGKHGTGEWFDKLCAQIRGAKDISQVHAFMVTYYNNYKNPCFAIKDNGKLVALDPELFCCQDHILDIPAFASYDTGRYSTVTLHCDGKISADFRRAESLPAERIAQINQQVNGYMATWGAVQTLRSNVHKDACNVRLIYNHYPNVQRFLIVAVLEDGSVKAVDSIAGRNDLCAMVEAQTDMADFAVVSPELVYGLKSNGSVFKFHVYNGKVYQEQLEDDWYGIAAIFPTHSEVLGIRADGKLVGFVSCCENWENLVSLSYSAYGLAGLTADGRVLLNWQSNQVAQWRLFESIEAWEAQDKAKKEQRQQEIAALTAQINALTAERDQLKGLFSGFRKKEIDTQLLQLNQKLKGLS